MESTYFKIEYGSTGHIKYVKTDSRGCEIILITPFEKKVSRYKSPYPISGENDYNLITEDEYKKGTECVGIVNINEKASIKETITTSIDNAKQIKQAIENKGGEYTPRKVASMILSNCDTIVKNLEEISKNL